MALFGAPRRDHPRVVAVRTGWFSDPVRRHRLRYRDGEWTAWVSDGRETGVDPGGVELIGQRRRRRIVVGMVAAVAGTLLLVGCFALVDRAMRSEEVRGVDEAIAEVDGWRLPPAVQRASRPDRVERGAFGATGPTVARWYVPAPGTSPADALQEFSRSLRAQGYDLTETPAVPGKASSTWDGHLRFSKYADFTVGLDGSGERIEVLIRPG